MISALLAMLSIIITTYFSFFESKVIFSAPNKQFKVQSNENQKYFYSVSIYTFVLFFVSFFSVFLFLFLLAFSLQRQRMGHIVSLFFKQFPAPHFSDGRTKKRLTAEKEAEEEEEDDDEALQLYNCKCFEFFSCVRQFYSQLVQAAVQIFAKSSAQWQSGLSFCCCCSSFCFVFYFGFGPLGANWVSTRRRRWTNRQTDKQRGRERDNETDRQRHSQSVSSSGSQRRNEKRDEASSKILNNRCNDLSISLSVCLFICLFLYVGRL